MSDSRFPYDSVVVLSQSNWYHEMRSNRFHYTTRFAELVPTFFVQHYDYSKNQLIEGVEGNITIVNPIHGYTYETVLALVRLLKERKLTKVLFWVYSPNYTKYLKRITFPYGCIYHATEAYVGSDMVDVTKDPSLLEFVDDVKANINASSFVVSVSEGITRSLHENQEISSPVYTISNGCDYEFWNGFQINYNERDNAVLYQGGIHKKIDVKLLILLARQNTNVKFWLCGEVAFDDKKDAINWQTLLRLPNVTFYGKLSPEEVKALSHKAKVGIIPFKINDWLVKKSFPLKAFEYLASGLEVVTIPIDALVPFAKHFLVANNYEEFNKHIRSALSSHLAYTTERIQACKEQDYDVKFNHLLQLITTNRTFYNNGFLNIFKKKVLLLYCAHSCRVNTIREHVNAFGLFSRHEITFFNATDGNIIDERFLHKFDVVVIHFSVRISVQGHLSDDIYEKLKKYKGYKVLFIQDEYDNLAMTYSYMESIDFDTVFTCVPHQFIDYVYPSVRFPTTKFVNNFTGYTSYALFNYNSPKISARKTHIFYRGRDLPYFYGTLGMEKYEIGIKFKKSLEAKGIQLTTDIESHESKRIYGDAWYYTLSRSKATLATESGSNVFDFDGNLEQLINEDVQQGKDYDYIYEKHLREREQHIKMNQISPKLFEAICLGTVLVLYEGEYSGVLQPGLHYISLKKDFSNIEDVVSILKDDEKLQQIADRAYNDIILNDTYSYQTFIQKAFDKEIDEGVFLVREHNLNEVFPKNMGLRDQLKRYLLNRTEVSKIKSGVASPQIMSEAYERSYLQSYNTIKWEIRDFSFLLLDFILKIYQLSLSKTRNLLLRILRSIQVRSKRMIKRFFSFL